MAETHLQIKWGHHPTDGWIVHCPVAFGLEPVKCGTREDAKRLYEGLKAVYKNGKNDLRGQFSELMKED